MFHHHVIKLITQRRWVTPRPWRSSCEPTHCCMRQHWAAFKYFISTTRFYLLGVNIPRIWFNDDSANKNLPREWTNDTTTTCIRGNVADIVPSLRLVGRQRQSVFPVKHGEENWILWRTFFSWPTTRWEYIKFIRGADMFGNTLVWLFGVWCKWNVLINPCVSNSPSFSHSGGPPSTRVSISDLMLCESSALITGVCSLRERRHNIGASQG